MKHVFSCITLLACFILAGCASEATAPDLPVHVTPTATAKPSPTPTPKPSPMPTPTPKPAPPVQQPVQQQPIHQAPPPAQQPPAQQPAPPPPAPSGGDKNCSDFATQGQAQNYFNSKGGSPSNNVDGLDANHNGVACESLPK